MAEDKTARARRADESIAATIARRRNAALVVLDQPDAIDLAVMGH
jgi:hypothetical protein